MVISHSNAGLISSRIIHALHNDTVKLFNYGETGRNFISTELVNFIQKNAIASGLLFCSFSPLTKVPCNAASTENSDSSAKEPTPITARKNGSAKNQSHGIEYSIKPSIEPFGDTLKPVTIPSSKRQLIFRIGVSWLGLINHDFLILVIIALSLLGSRERLSRHMKFICIRHVFLLLVV